jgi:hypothetical protein
MQRRPDLAAGPFDFSMAAMSYQHDIVSRLSVSAPLAVHLANERACGVDYIERSFCRGPLDSWGNAMSAEDRRRAFGYLGDVVDEDRPARAQAFDDMLVVHDLMPHVHGRAVQIEGALDNLDSANNAGAETTWSR